MLRSKWTRLYYMYVNIDTLTFVLDIQNKLYFLKTTLLGINYNASQETTPRLDFQGGSKLRVKLLATYIIALHPSSTGKKYIVKLDLALFWLMNKNIIKLILKNWLICSAFNGTETGMNIDIRMQLINKIHLHCFFRNFKNIYL